MEESNIIRNNRIFFIRKFLYSQDCGKVTEKNPLE